MDEKGEKETPGPSTIFSLTTSVHQMDGKTFKSIWSIFTKLKGGKFVFLMAKYVCTKCGQKVREELPEAGPICCLLLYSSWLSNSRRGQSALLCGQSEVAVCLLWIRCRPNSPSWPSLILGTVVLSRDKCTRSIFISACRGKSEINLTEIGQSRVVLVLIIEWQTETMINITYFAGRWSETP